jgi:hypothetical protein
MEVAMKGVGRYVLGSAVLIVAGSVCLLGGMLDRRIARTQQNLTTLTYDDAAFASLERYVTYASRIPGIGRGLLNDVRARKAASQYWHRQYSLVVPDQADPVAAIPADNVELQVIVADAVYRNGQTRAKDKASTLQALDAAINAYLAVLKNAGRHDAAAYNYEYLVRVREDVDKGRRAPELTDTTDEGPTGRSGAPPPQDSNQRKFKLLIPLEPGELDKAIEPGKGTPIERKG